MIFANANLIWGTLAGLFACGTFAAVEFSGGHIEPPVTVPPVTVLPVTVPAVAVPPAASEDDLESDLDRRLAGDVTPLLAKFCLGCHSGDEPDGDVPLDELTSARGALAGGLDLRLIREMVSTSAMPPKKKPQPSDHERLVLTQWLDAMIAYVPTDAPIDPGWFTIHRLNRSEYRNTMRDLLGIEPAEVDLAARLPRDDTGYGFDNVADVLSTSPLAIEEYLAAAERAIDLGLGPAVEFGDTPRAIRPLTGGRGQTLPRGGFLLYSNGDVSGEFNAPLTGEYVIRVRAWETPAGDEHARVALRVGRRELSRFDVSGTRAEPQEQEHRLRLPRGTHRIAASFLNDYYVPEQADRNLAVESITVAGPLDEGTTERPDAWRHIFEAGSSSGDDSARARAVLTAFASRAYRRPATAQQVDSLIRVYQAQRDTGLGHELALRSALSAVLVSPNFLFRTVAHPDAANPEARYSLDGYELASRLSFFLWSSMPDAALLSAAADGSLNTDEGLLTHTRRLLADPRSQAFVENFAGQWLQIRALPSVAIDRARFPDYTDALRDAMIGEATMFVGDVLRSGRSLLEFIDSDSTFLNEPLAKLYGIPDVQGEQMRRVALPTSSQRGGVLTMGAVLTLTSNTTRTSPVKRGLFVLDQLLGAPPPPPPADVPPLEQAAALGPDATVRERLAAHLADTTCASCHRRLDPIGLAMENYDAIGRWRDQENDRPVDATGTLPSGETIDGVTDLKRALLDRADQFIEALTARVLTYALGRGTEPFDRPAVRLIARRTREQNDTFTALIESIVLSETFRTCRGRKPTHE